MGAQIAGSTGTAAQLTQTAQQYASGNLTPAQQQQVAQYAAAEQASATAALGNRADSSTRTAQMTQINNNAAMLAQSSPAARMVARARTSIVLRQVKRERLECFRAPVRPQALRLELEHHPVHVRLQAFHR